MSEPPPAPRRRRPIRLNSGPCPPMPPFSPPNGQHRRSTTAITPPVARTPVLSPVAVAQTPRTTTTPLPPPRIPLSSIPSVSGTKVCTSANDSTRMFTNLTVYGHVDAQLQSTVRTLRQQNVGIVIRDESEMLRILKESKKRKLEPSYIGKGKGKENQCPPLPTPPPVNWDDMVMEFKRMNNTDRRGWGIHNRIFVQTGCRWPSYVDMETSTFCRVMLRMVREAKDSSR